MLRIPLDEGAVFDILAVLAVKIELCQEPEKKKQIEKQFDTIFFDLINQIGQDVFSVIRSQEFFNLIDANKETFILVDKAKKNEVSAKEVDDSNTKRYNIKVALQKKWFNTEPLEQKNV